MLNFPHSRSFALPLPLPPLLVYAARVEGAEGEKRAVIN
ncbi:unnamed protein product [Ectocarpus sp. CCAP 1310/34]|nr:unnamed protein product [Ectocarpus sp. CCAP 1310/34]